MTERFNVAGAMLVKLFGDHDREDEQFERHAAGVRDAGIRSAMYGRVFFVALGLVGAVGAAAIYGVGGHLVVTGDISSGTLVALAALVDPGLLAADRADERPRRPDDVARQLRARLRGARRTRADRRATRRRRPRRPDGAGDVRRRALPLPAGGRDDASRRSSSTRRRPTPIATSSTASASTSCRARPSPSSACRAPASRRSPSLVPRLYDVTAGRVLHRRPRRARPHAGVAAGGHRRRRPGPAPVPRDDRRQPALRQAGRHRPTSWSTACRAARILDTIADAARRLRHGRRRPRLPPVGRREAAHRHRPPAAEGPGRR